MAHIFEIKDKSGKKVRLTSERWQHIVIEHPALSGKIEEIKDTILYPTSIKKSKYGEDVRFHFKLLKEMSKYLMVSVKYLNGEGFVITAFYTSKLSK